jgi:hypothetical protein
MARCRVDVQDLGGRLVEKERGDLESDVVIPLHPKAYQGGGAVVTPATWSEFIATLHAHYEITWSIKYLKVIDDL